MIPLVLPETLILPLAIGMALLAGIVVSSLAYRVRQLARLERESTWAERLESIADSPVLDDVIVGGITVLHVYEQLPETAEMLVSLLDQLPDSADAAVAAAAEAGLLQAAGEGLGDGLLIGLAYRAIRNGSRYMDGRLDGKTALGDTLTDSALTSGGAALGGTLATLAAAVAGAPLTGGASLIPAIGAIFGAITGGKAGRLWKGRHHRRALEAVEAAKKEHRYSLGEFARKYVASAHAVAGVLRGVHRQQLRELRLMIRASGWFLRRWLLPSDDTTLLVHARRAAKRRFREQTLPRLSRLVAEVQTALHRDPARAGMLLYGQGEGVLVDLPHLVDARRHVDRAWDHVVSRVQQANAEAEKLNARR